MASQSTNVALRKFTIISFVPGFIILLIHGIISNCPFPALGILPTAASAVLGLYIIRRDVVAALGSPVQALSESNVFFADIFLAAFHLLFLIISWAAIQNPWHRGQIVLGTYGTVFMMLDFGIHVYVLLPQVGHLLVQCNCDCPHCRGMAKAGFMSSSRVSEYTPLSEGDVEAEIVERDVEGGITDRH